MGTDARSKDDSSPRRSPGTSATRGAHPSTPLRYRVGDLIVDLGLAQVSRNEQTIPLPKLSFDLLVALMRAAPNLISLDSLMSTVWVGLVVSPETVSQRAKLLRDALEDDPKEPHYIAGVRGRGYRLIAPITPLEPAAPSAPTTVLPPPLPTEPAPIVMPPPGRNVRRRWLGVAAAVALAGFAFAIWIWGSRAGDSQRPQEKQVGVARVPIQSVAVLPFANLSDEPNSRIVALGLAESVLHQLASHNQLIVIARTSSFAFEGRNVDAREVGRQLNARYLLEGSLQTQQSRLRVTAQLIDTQSGADVWSMQFDRTATDLFAVQDEISVAVARALESSVTVSATPARTETKSIEAWMAYQQGRALAATRKLADLDLAQERFAEATRIDPDFSLAYVARAEIRAVRSMFQESDTWLGLLPRLTDAERSEAMQWLARAIALNPREGTAYTVRAWLAEHAADAEADYRRGLALSPNDAVGYERFAKRLFSLYQPDGRFFDPGKRAEAFEMIDRATTLNPLSVTTHIAKALMTLYGRGNATEAKGELLKALELQPNYYPAIMRLAEVHYSEGDTAEAIRLAEQALSLEPQAVWTRHFLVGMYLDLGDAAAARQLVEQGLKADNLLPVPLYVYERNWKRASDVASQDTEFYLPLNDGPTVWAWVQNAKATRDFETYRKKLQDWGSVRWSSNGEPRIQENNLAYADCVAMAEIMAWMGQKESADRLLREVERMLDHGEKDLKRGERMYGTTRAATRALLGDREGALQSLQDIGMNHWWYVLEYEPAFDGLRHDPRFEALRRQVQAKVAAQRAHLDKLRADGAVPARAAAVVSSH